MKVFDHARRSHNDAADSHMSPDEHRGVENDEVDRETKDACSSDLQAVDQGTFHNNCEPSKAFTGFKGRSLSDAQRGVASKDGEGLRILQPVRQREIIVKVLEPFRSFPLKGLRWRTRRGS